MRESFCIKNSKELIKLTPTIKNFEELPLILKVEEVGKILGVSRATAYTLVRSKGFPCVRVGAKLLVVPRDRFISWLHNNADLPFE